MPIDRTEVGKAQVLEELAVDEQGFYGVFDGIDRVVQRRAHARDALEEPGRAALEAPVPPIGAQAVQVFGQRAHVLGDGHGVVVEHDDERQLRAAGVVERLDIGAVHERAVPDQGDAVVVLPAQARCARKAQRRGDRRAAVARAEGVALALLPAGEAAQPPCPAQGGELVQAAGQELVRIALVAHVEQELVARQVVDVVQRDRQLHRAQVAGKVAAVARDDAQDLPADLLAELLELAQGEPAKVCAALDLL